MLFNKVAMRPGSVTTVAFVDGKYLFGLSGNPSACFTGFELFVKPAVKHMCGALEVFPQIIKATLMEDFTKANPFTRFIRAKATLTSAGATVVPSGFNKSGAVVAIAHANCMVMLPGGSRGFKAGHTVDIILTESDAAEEGTSFYDFTNCRLQKSGKTTLMRHIVSFLKSHGYTVATIKTSWAW